jgi:uncharacterized protein YjaZ
MELHAIGALTGLRAALEAPAERRLALFREGVMEPLRPFWEPFMGWMPQAPGADQGDPALNAARTFGYYTPELDVPRGLAALDRLDRAGAWPGCLDALWRAWDALAPEAHDIPIRQVRFTLVLGDPAKLGEREGSYTGFGGAPGTVMVMAWPTDFNLPRLPAIVPHELHHNVRFSWEPFVPHETTVGQYIVAEGLAEAFAAEVCGEELLGPWVAMLSDEQVAALSPRYRDALDVRGFDTIRGYIFGDGAAEQSGYTPLGLPDFAGYSLGYRLARAYLARTGKGAAEATYVPWREVVEESRFFEGE